MIIMCNPNSTVLKSHVAEPQLASWEEGAGRYMISDSVARTIGSWYQENSGPALAFAILASSGTADQEELLAAIEAERITDDEKATELTALFHWATGIMTDHLYYVGPY